MRRLSLFVVVVAIAIGCSNGKKKTTAPLTIITTALPDATEGQPYSFKVEATGGKEPYSWKARNLPSGLDIDSSTGRIYGTPGTQTAGSYNVEIEVEDASNPPRTDTKVFTLIVNPPLLQISTTSLPVGEEGVNYNATLSATGGVPPYAWAEITGDPDGDGYDLGDFGLTLNSDGSISGTPTRAGTVTFVAEVADSATPTPSTAQKSLTIKIVNAKDWTQVSPTTSPPPRTACAMAYDENRGVCVLFGGMGSGMAVYDDTWEYDGTDWQQKFPSNVPWARFWTAMVYDSKRKVIVLFGGCDAGWGVLDDTWEYDGNDWKQITTANKPPARCCHAMAYDAKRGVVVLFGGYDAGWNLLNDVWEYDGTDWRQVTTANSPSARSDHAMVYDADKEVIVLFGGNDGASDLSDTWLYDGNDWTEVTPTNKPTVRSQHGMVYDSERRVVVLFGGIQGTSYLNETWEFDGSEWRERNPAHSPSARSQFGFAYDSVRKKAVLFGGWNPLYDDTWEY
ncbi:MAG: hypothetical protein DRP82_02910 [Planctomycetota bacterium]|nr:MAG: hypothetical protein DRP82_02910 [Planctomycetota bacterium]